MVQLTPASSSGKGKASSSVQDISVYVCMSVCSTVNEAHLRSGSHTLPRARPQRKRSSP